MKITKQSELGIASFIFALIPIVISLLFLMFLAIDSLPNTGGCKGCGSDSSNHLGIAVLYGIHLIFTSVIGFTGFLFGFASLFQKKVKNTYGKIGFVVCGIYLLLIGFSFL